MIVYSNENKIVRFTLLKSDGTALNVAATQEITVRLYVNGYFSKAFKVGTDPEARQGNAANEVELEITQDLMKSLGMGKVIARVIVTVTDAEHTLDQVQVDVSEHDLFIIK